MVLYSFALFFNINFILKIFWWNLSNFSLRISSIYKYLVYCQYECYNESWASVFRWKCLIYDGVIVKLFNIYCVAVVTVIACMSTLYAAEAPRFSRDPREVLRTDHYQEIKRLACDHGQRVKKIDDIALASGCAAGCCCCACGALSCCICSHVAPYFIPPIFAQMVPPVQKLAE